jgi:hypothetical protein
MDTEFIITQASFVFISNGRGLRSCVVGAAAARLVGCRWQEVWRLHDTLLPRTAVNFFRCFVHPMLRVRMQGKYLANYRFSHRS